MLNKFQTPVFNIAVGVVENDNIFDLSSMRLVHNIYSTRNPLALNPVVIEADPFLFIDHDRLFLFYEEQRGAYGKGILKMTSTLDLQTWTMPVTILTEPFHLSYPNVFRYGGHVYMLPETGHNCDIRLYEMSADMTSCKFVRTLVKGANFVDSTIYADESSAYLLTSIYKGNEGYEGRIYVGNLDLEDWAEHPMSPYSVDRAVARSGGPIVSRCGKIYRMAQDCSGQYGGGLNAYRIVGITPDRYDEQFESKILPNSVFVLGGHQYSMVEFKGRNVVAVDYLSHNVYLTDIISRVKGKLFSRKQK